jgi:chromosome partitioning protein
MGEQANGRSRCIAISSQKGGVAKTTTAVSLGASLVELGASVLLIDLDPQGHLTQSMGVEPERMRVTVGDVLLRQATIAEASREGSVFNLDLLPANRGLILVEKLLHNNADYEYRLESSLDELGFYDVVIIDCPPSFGPLTINALTASELVIVPVICDYFSARSLQSYLRLLSMVQRNSNPEIDYRLLVTMFDARIRLSKLIYEQYSQSYGDHLLETMIPVYSKLRESPVFGRPITEYASRARSAQHYRDLARELTKCLKMTI